MTNIEEQISISRKYNPISPTILKSIQQQYPDIANCWIHISNAENAFLSICHYISENPNDEYKLICPSNELKSFVLKDYDNIGYRFYIGYGYLMISYNENVIIILKHYGKRGFDEVKGISETKFLLLIAKNRNILEKFIYRAKEWHKSIMYKVISLYIFGDGWRRMCPINARNLNSVILSKKNKKILIDGIHSFLSDETKNWYREKGINYKMTFLIHGAPGVGKTSTIYAIATHFKMSVYSIDSTFKNTSGSITEAMTLIPQQSLCILEDVDALFNNHRENQTRNNNITFSELLNVLDGLVNLQGLIVIMTTNYPERLDKALTRNGRVDEIVELTFTTPSLARKMFLHFYPNQLDHAILFAKNMFEIKKKKVSQRNINMVMFIFLL